MSRPRDRLDLHARALEGASLDPVEAFALAGRDEDSPAEPRPRRAVPDVLRVVDVDGDRRHAGDAENGQRRNDRRAHPSALPRFLQGEPDERREADQADLGRMPADAVW